MIRPFIEELGQNFEELVDGATDDEDSDGDQDETGLASIIAELLRAYETVDRDDAVFLTPDDDEDSEEDSF